MQIEDLLTLAVHEGLRRRLEKRGNALLPVAVGAMLPGIVRTSVQRARETRALLDHSEEAHDKQAAAPGSPMGRGVGGMAAASAHPMGRSVGAMADMLAHSAARPGMPTLPTSGIQGVLSVLGAGALLGLGKELGSGGMDIIRGLAGRARDATANRLGAGSRAALVQELMQTDTVIRQADPAIINDAYETMSRFAPTLATDRNAVRSFLRQAAMAGTGPDYMSIKLLADSERAALNERA